MIQPTKVPYLEMEPMHEDFARYTNQVERTDVTPSAAEVRQPDYQSDTNNGNKLSHSIHNEDSQRRFKSDIPQEMMVDIKDSKKPRTSKVMKKKQENSGAP